MSVRSTLAGHRRAYRLSQLADICLGPPRRCPHPSLHPTPPAAARQNRRPCLPIRPPTVWPPSDQPLPHQLGRPGPRAVRGGSPPAQLGRYHVVKELGRGAMGLVYLGKDPRSNASSRSKPCAWTISTARRNLKDFRDRFFRGQNRPDVCHIPTSSPCTTRAKKDGLAYIAMEYLEGRCSLLLSEVDVVAPSKHVLHIVAAVADAARLCAWPGRHPSGCRSPQHHAPETARGKSDGLRHRQNGDGIENPASLIVGAALRVAGTGDREDGRPIRCVFVGSRALRVVDRGTPVSTPITCPPS